MRKYFKNMKKQQGFIEPEDFAPLLVMFSLPLLFLVVVMAGESDRKDKEEKIVQNVSEIKKPTAIIDIVKENDIKTEHVIEVEDNKNTIKKDIASNNLFFTEKISGNIYDLYYSKNNWSYFFFDKFLVTNFNSLGDICSNFKKISINNIGKWNYSNNDIKELYESRKYITIAYIPINLNMLKDKESLSDCNLSTSDNNVYYKEKQLVLLKYIED